MSVNNILCTFVMMKIKLISFLLVSVLVFSCKQDKEPVAVVQFQIDKENKVLFRCENVTSPKLVFDWLINDSLSIKDSTTIDITKYINDGHRTEAAYKYAVDGKLQIGISAFSNGVKVCDTLLDIRIPDINPIFLSKPIKLVKGNLCPFVTNVQSANNLNYIRGWLYDHEYRLDSTQMSNMSFALYHFSMPTKLIYKLDKSRKVPVCKTLPNDPITIESDIKADSYYFVLASNDEELKSAIRDIIKNNIPSNIEKQGQTFTGKWLKYTDNNISTVFMVGINNDWSENVQPVGVLAIDDCAPSIFARKSRSFGFGRIGHYYSNLKIESCFNTHNLKFNLTKYNYSIKDNFESDINSSASVTYDSFEGNDYSGYDIPFNLSISGDVQYLTIDNRKFSAAQIKSKPDVRIHFRKLHIGNNKIRITASDKWGNVSTQILSIPITYSRSDNTYSDNYDDLEDRISDLEGRIDGLEN